MVVSNAIPNPDRAATAWTRAARLCRYVLGLDLYHANEKCLEALGLGFIGTSPAQQIYEMQIAASCAKRSDNPIHHQVLSWPLDEAISSDRFKEIVYDYVNFYNFEGLQIVAGLHQDTDNFHIHFIVNKFDIEHDRIVQINGGFDRFHAARFCCYLEDKYGYEPSENAAAYKIGNEIVLSDLYKIDSASGHIEKKSVHFKAESAASKLKKIVLESLYKAKSWQQFRSELSKRDVVMEPGVRGGLVYSCRENGTSEVRVAASRVSKRATLKSLQERFGDDTESMAVSTGSEVEVTPQEPGAEADMMAAADVYARYSAPPTALFLSNPRLEAVVEKMTTLFPRSHILFSRQVRGVDTRLLHLIDRARGDSRPLERSEVMGFLPNLIHLMRKGRELRLCPSPEPGMGSQTLALSGPHSALAGLNARGLFPAAIQEVGSTSRFVFLRVATEDADRLSKAANALNCQVVQNPSLLIADLKAVIPVHVDPVHLQPPPLLPQLLPSSQIQFLGKFDELRSGLSASLDMLKSKALRSIRVKSQMKWLKSSLARLNIANSFKKLNGDLEHVTTKRAKVDGGQFASGFGSAFVRLSRVDPSFQGNDGSGQRLRSDASDFRRSNVSVAGLVGFDIATEQTAREAGARGEVRLKGSSSGAQDYKSSATNGHEIRGADEATGDNSAEPGDFASRAWTATLQTPDGAAELTPARRMLLCLKIAQSHGLQARWDGEIKESIVIQREAAGDLSNVDVVARVTDRAIELQPEADRGLIARLQSELGLPALGLFAPEKTDGHANVPDPDGFDHGAEFDVWDSESFAPDNTDEPEKVSPTHGLRPKPHSVVFDLEGLWAAETLEDGILRIASLDALGEYDLASVENITLLVSNQLDLANTVQLENFERSAREAGLPEEVAIQAHLLESYIELTPRTLVLVLSSEPAFEPYTADEDDEAVVCHLSGDQIHRGQGIALYDLRDVIIYDARNVHEPDPFANELEQDAVAALQDRLGTWFTSIAPNTPEFHYTNGDLDEELRRIRRGNDDDYDYSM